MFPSYKYRLSYLFLTLMVVSACATNIPKPIDEKIDFVPNTNIARQNLNTYIGHRIRWGGIIANVRNEKDSTIVEIVTHPLDRQGRPAISDQTYGRFLARIKGFLDPMVYTKGRELTVVGTIIGESSALIGLYEYSYVEVDVETFKLWPPIEKVNEYYYDPYWYGPWYRGFPRHPYYYNPWWY